MRIQARDYVRYCAGDVEHSQRVFSTAAGIRDKTLIRPLSLSCFLAVATAELCACIPSRRIRAHPASILMSNSITADFARRDARELVRATCMCANICGIYVTFTRAHSTYSHAPSRCAPLDGEYNILRFRMHSMRPRIISRRVDT